MKIILTSVMLLFLIGIVVPHVYADETEEWCKVNVDRNDKDNLGYLVCYGEHNIIENSKKIKTVDDNNKNKDKKDDKKMDALQGNVTSLIQRIDKLESYEIDDLTQDTEIVGYFSYLQKSSTNDNYYLYITLDWISHAYDTELTIIPYAPNSTEIASSGVISITGDKVGPRTSYFVVIRVADWENGEAIIQPSDNYGTPFDPISITIDKSQFIELTITQLDYNPPVGESSWIEVVNTGTLDVDMFDWRVTTSFPMSPAHYDYPFRDPFVLKSNESIIIDLEITDISEAVQNISISSRNMGGIGTSASIAYNEPFSDPYPGEDHWEYDVNTYTWSFTGNQ